MERKDTGLVEELGAVEAILRGAHLEAQPSEAPDRPVLGHDPFTDETSFDPFSDRLATIGPDSTRCLILPSLALTLLMADCAPLTESRSSV